MKQDYYHITALPHQLRTPLVYTTPAIGLPYYTILSQHLNHTESENGIRMLCTT